MDENVRRSRMVVSRRRALASGSIGIAALLAACAPKAVEAGGVPADQATSTPAPTPSVTPTAPQPPGTAEWIAKLDASSICQLTSEETQGPYWFDVDAIRSDIREDRPGTPLHLVLRVVDQACTPIPNSVVEVWHCDAGGVYSGYEVASSGGPRSGDTELSDGQYSQGVTENVPADDGTYLRGAQVADADGLVQFRTIWPGWYTGRTVHIHLKVHINRVNVLTSQLYFDDALTDTVFTQDPYAAHPGRDRTNLSDGIYDPSGLLIVEELPVEHSAGLGATLLAYTNLGVPS